MEMHEIYLVSSIHISLPIPLNEVNREWAKGTDDERSGSGMGCEPKRHGEPRDRRHERDTKWRDEWRVARLSSVHSTSVPSVLSTFGTGTGPGEGPGNERRIPALPTSVPHLVTYPPSCVHSLRSFTPSSGRDEVTRNGRREEWKGTEARATQWHEPSPIIRPLSRSSHLRFPSVRSTRLRHEWWAERVTWVT